MRNFTGFALVTVGAGFIFGAGTAFLDGAPRWYCAETFLVGLLGVLAGAIILARQQQTGVGEKE